jgi:hypothetical protein
MDPTPLVVASNLAATTNVITSSVTPTRSIPTGTPWFYFDGNTDLCNRFAIIFPTWPFSAIATATFAGTNTASVTWPVPFGSTSYSIINGPPTDDVIINIDGTTKTTTGVTLRSSDVWTGSVSVIAYASGVNPLNVFASTSFGALKSLILSFRPNALCMGVYAIAAGNMLGYSNITLGSGTTLGSTITKALSAF